jgi:hypothetical protein
VLQGAKTGTRSNNGAAFGVRKTEVLKKMRVVIVKGESPLWEGDVK